MIIKTIMETETVWTEQYITWVELGTKISTKSDII